MTDVLYYKDERGIYVEDKRNSQKEFDSMEIQQSVYKLTASVDSMKEIVETSLEAVKDKITNLDEKIGNNIQLIEKKLESNDTEHTSISTLVDEHDTKIREAKKYIDEIKVLQSAFVQLKGEVLGIKKEVYDMKIAPVKQKAAWIDDFCKVLKGIIFTAIASGIVGFIAYLVSMYLKSGVL